jgi:hypothetical protein
MNETAFLLPHIKLRLTIDHPNIEECYAYGYESAVAEISEDDNPYLPKTIAYEQWQEGWWAGFYEEKPLFPSINDTKKVTIDNKPTAGLKTYTRFNHQLVSLLLKVGGAITATLVVGYQFVDFVA